MPAKSTKKKDKPVTANNDNKSKGSTKPVGTGGGKGKNKKKGKKRGKGKKKIIDWAAKENFDPNRVIITIEHTEECPIFKTKAMDFLTFLQTTITDKTFLLLRNETGPPRDGAFEIYISQNAKTPKELIWTGINKGPPRRDKFPTAFDNLLPDVIGVLNKLYMIENDESHHDGDDDLLMLDQISDEVVEESDKQISEKPDEPHDVQKVFKEENIKKGKSSSKRVSAGADKKLKRLSTTTAAAGGVNQKLKQRVSAGADQKVKRISTGTGTKKIKPVSGSFHKKLKPITATNVGAVDDKKPKLNLTNANKKVKQRVSAGADKKIEQAPSAGVTDKLKAKTVVTKKPHKLKSSKSLKLSESKEALKSKEGISNVIKAKVGAINKNRTKKLLKTATKIIANPSNNQASKA